jgi:glycosyltransferase involved in cell wall biosynthesis
MKILVIQDRLRSGGTERQSLLLTRAFSRQGHDSGLLTFRPGGQLAPAAAGLNLRALQPFDFGLDWFAPCLVGVARRRKPDVILAMGRMANCHAAFLQRGLPATPVVATLRTGKPLPWLYRRSLRRASHVVANSRDARDALVARFGVPPEKTSVIPNALVLPARDPMPRDDAARAALGAGPGTAVLLSVAMFRREKGQRELIEIVAGLPPVPDWQLWLAGDGPARAECERLAGDRGLGSRVKFIGYRPDPAPLYAQADFAVHASSSESLSNFLIEAQAAGLPAVAAEAQGVRECLVPDRTGLVVPAGDRSGFRAALVRLIGESPEARSARGAEARAFARAAFDPARQVAAYLDLFERLRGGSQ